MLVNIRQVIQPKQTFEEVQSSSYAKQIDGFNQYMECQLDVNELRPGRLTTLLGVGKGSYHHKHS